MDPSTYLSFYTYVCLSTCVSMYLPTYLSVLSLSPGALSKNLQPKNSTPFSPRNRSRHPPRSCIGHFHHLGSSPSIVPHPLPNCNTQMLVRFHEIQSIRGPGVLRMESGGGNSSGYSGTRRGEEKEERDGMRRSTLRRQNSSGTHVLGRKN